MKYSTPILLGLAIVFNSVSSLFKGMKHITTWAGYVGYPEYYHYWYLFNHKIQFFIYLAIPLFIIARKEINLFDYRVIVWYGILSLCETLIYLTYGNYQTELQAAIEFGMFVSLYLIGIFYLIWRR